MNEQSDSFVTEFFRLESAGGILLFFASILAMIFANSGLQNIYSFFVYPRRNLNRQARDSETTTAVD
jgi:Na+/H+ antiporter NhaA